MAITLNDFKEGGALRRFVTQVGLLDKIGAEGEDQEQLLKVLVTSVTNVGTYEDTNKDGKLTEEDSIAEGYANKDDEGGEGGEGGDDSDDDGGEGGDDSGDDGGEGGDTPVEPETVTIPTTFKIVASEKSWNAAYDNGNGTLGKYYEDHPEEDLWNTVENRAVNFNDRWYTGTIDGQEVSCGTAWAADGVQKITVDGTDYFCEIWGYDLNPHNAELFTNVELTEPANKTFEIATVSFSADCVHCWQGSLNAPGAAYPWLVITLPEPATGVIKVTGGSKLGNAEVYPWCEEEREFTKGYAICSIPTEFDKPETKIDPETGKASVKIISTDITVAMTHTEPGVSVASQEELNGGN